MFGIVFYVLWYYFKCVHIRYIHVNHHRNLFCSRVINEQSNAIHACT